MKCRGYNDPRSTPRGCYLLCPGCLCIRRALPYVMAIMRLQAIREGSYDVILCDVRMPGLDGLGLYRELEQHYPHLLSRMIFLTGDVLSSEARDFFEQVDCLRLIKPFRAREVRQLIQQMLAAQ
jgi:CheY-like chemotaxis protein